jgi:arylsulfatase A-like enzyme
LDVIEEQGLFSDTIFVLHSDHGEEFWEHGGVGHGHDLWDELLHVPLGIVYPSAVPAGVRVERRVRTIDVFPTLLDLLGLDPRSYGFDVSDGASAVVGRSLVPCIDGGGRVEDRVAMAEALLYGPPVDRWQEAKALYVGDLKLIAGGLSATDRLFDLSRDPHENENVAAELRTEASELRARLTRNRDYTTPSTESSSGVRIDPVMKQELSDLGYVGTGTQEDGADPEDP